MGWQYRYAPIFLNRAITLLLTTDHTVLCLCWTELNQKKVLTNLQNFAVFNLFACS